MKRKSGATTEERKKNGSAKRAAAVLLAALLLVSLAAAAAYGANAKKPTSADVRILVDGEPLVSDTDPYIYGERTMVPFRAVGEAVGATVGWDDAAKMATYHWRGNVVQVTIDSENAFVNGTWTILDEPAQLTNSRTFIPIRFVAESLGCGVGWDEETRTVLITSPSEEAMRANVTSFRAVQTETGVDLVLSADRPLENVRKTVAEGKMVVRVENAALRGDFGPFGGSDAAFAIPDEFFTAASVAADPDNPADVLLTVDLTRKIAGRLSFSDDERTLTVRFTEDAVDGATDAYANAAAAKGLPALDWRAAGSLVVLDPGHGGRDPGSVAKLNGKQIYESRINLAVALKARDLLEAAGVRVVMTREDDSFPLLYSRPTLANTLHADLTVSIHNNAHTSKSVHGTELHYHVMDSEAAYPVDSFILGTNIFSEMTALLNMKGRGMVDNSNLALVNRCLMPSCIVEGAYLTNASDLAYMVTDDFQSKYALAVARGIIRTLNESAEAQ